jgi:hypothetical protein
MKFTLLQARLYFHLLQGERLYREWKSAHDQDAGLGALTELALARHTWDNEKSFIATSGMKGNPLMPSTRPLEDRAAEMLAAITQAPASVVGVNGAGFGMDVLAEHLLNGVSGYMLSGPTGSRAVLWTDVAPSRSPLRIGQGLAGHDEFGRPVKVEDQDLRAAPVVIDAAGFPAYKLFDALFEG